MKVLDPGHLYSLDILDAEPGDKNVWLQFVKRIGDKFPGNEPPGYPGTTTQEVLRALIDRTRYVDSQLHFDSNDSVIMHLQFALCFLEYRAALARDDEQAALQVWSHVDNIEMLEVCSECHHVLCRRSHEP